MPNSIYEKLYYQLPWYCKDIAFSLNEVRNEKRRFGNYFKKKLSYLKKSEWWSKNEIEEYKNKEFLKIINYSYQYIPFYKELYDLHGVKVKNIRSLEDIKMLPILKKEYLKENISKFDTLKRMKGTPTKIYLTSGTTGKPLLITKTIESESFQFAIWWRHKSRFGIKPLCNRLTFGARTINNFNNNLKPFRKPLFTNRSYINGSEINEASAKEIINFINISGFEFFEGYPSAIDLLSKEMINQKLTLDNPPRIIFAGSDQLLNKQKSRWGKTFGVPISEQYGMVEFAGNLSKCENGNYHEDFECGHVELIKKDEQSIKKIILTGWGNIAMPLIRYEIGDFSDNGIDKCSCGRESKCFGEIQGRLEDYIMTNEGRKIMGMNQVFEYATNAIEIQAYQDDLNSVEFRIVPNQYFSDVDKNALIREFRRRAGNKIKINFKIVDKINLTSKGKYKAVISKLK